MKPPSAFITRATASSIACKVLDPLPQARRHTRRHVDLLEDVAEAVVVLLQRWCPSWRTRCPVDVEGAYSKQLPGRSSPLGFARQVCMPERCRGKVELLPARASRAVCGSVQLHRAGTETLLRVLACVAVGVTRDSDGPARLRTQLDAATVMGVRNGAVQRGADGAVRSSSACSRESYSSVRAAFGVMVAHFTATPRRLVASAWNRRSPGRHWRCDAPGPGRGTPVFQIRYAAAARPSVICPDDARHLVAVHLHERRNFIPSFSPQSTFPCPRPSLPVFHTRAILVGSGRTTRRRFPAT